MLGFAAKPVWACFLTPTNLGISAVNNEDTTRELRIASIRTRWHYEPVKGSSRGLQESMNFRVYKHNERKKSSVCYLLINFLQVNQINKFIKEACGGKKKGSAPLSFYECLEK